MNAFGRVSRYLFLVSSIFLITGIFGYLYYAETVRKEEYFNQLAFRKLGEASRGLETNLKRLMNFTGQTRADLTALQKEPAAESDGTDTVGSRDFEEAQEQLLETVGDYTWNGLQEEVEDFSRDLQEALGLQEQMDAQEVACVQQAPPDSQQNIGYSSRVEEHCIVLSFFLSWLRKCRRLSNRAKRS